VRKDSQIKNKKSSICRQICRQTG